jgi:hypothetical protein
MSLASPVLKTTSDESVTTSPSSASLLAAIAYADLFSYPLTQQEVACYQVCSNLLPEDVEGELDALVAGGRLIEQGGLFALPGRERLFRIRARREDRSRRIWARALQYERLLRSMPFVRMVSVTGALAVNNINGKADIDLLVLAEPGRVWVCRRLLVLVVRLGRIMGDDLCPNYILSTDKLSLDQQDFFTAHELAQMVPLYGGDLHQLMLAANPWAQRYLPAAFSRGRMTQETGAVTKRGSESRGRRFLERFLGHRIFDRLENWELSRLREKLRASVGDAAEVVCTPDQCKGHTGLHRQNILARYGEKLQQLGIGAQFDWRE